MNDIKKIARYLSFSSLTAMIAIPTIHGTFLAVVSVASLSVFFVLCLWFKKKPRLIHEVNHIYDPQVFHREGSRFAVRRSKTVTRPNQIMRQLPPTPPILSKEPSVLPTQTTQNEIGHFEPTYVHPIPALVYQNVDESLHGEGRDADTDADQCPYENVFPSLSISETVDHNSDGCDYENSDFLEHIQSDQGDDEPDYVNADES